MNIRAYLSYRKNDLASGELEQFRGICAQAPEPIDLVYSERDDALGVRSGESFVDFMNNDLLGARFLILFCSPEYLIPIQGASAPPGPQRISPPLRSHTFSGPRPRCSCSLILAV